LVGIMFIIFDIEVAFLLPWCISFQINNIESFLVFLVIVLIFILGFIFESKAKVLDWNRLDLKKKNEKLL
jgi:NADH-quinone oxidoreductase subunit A